MILALDILVSPCCKNVCFPSAFLITHFRDASTDTWIGLNDVNSEYTFLWTDGSGVYYTNWAKGFPHYRSQVNVDCK